MHDILTTSGVCALAHTRTHTKQQVSYSEYGRRGSAFLLTSLTNCRGGSVPLACQRHSNGRLRWFCHALTCVRGCSDLMPPAEKSGRRTDPGRAHGRQRSFVSSEMTITTLMMGAKWGRRGGKQGGRVRRRRPDCGWRTPLPPRPRHEEYHPSWNRPELCT